MGTVAAGQFVWGAILNLSALGSFSVFRWIQIIKKGDRTEQSVREKLVPTGRSRIPASLS